MKYLRLASEWFNWTHKVYYILRYTSGGRVCNNIINQLIMCADDISIKISGTTKKVEFIKSIMAMSYE